MSDFGRGKLRALDDPKIRARIREAEERVQNGRGPEDDLMSAEQLEAVIADLRAGRRREPLEDHKP